MPKIISFDPEDTVTEKSVIYEFQYGSNDLTACTIKSKSKLLAWATMLTYFAEEGVDIKINVPSNAEQMPFKFAANKRKALDEYFGNSFVDYCNRNEFDLKNVMRTATAGKVAQREWLNKTCKLMAIDDKQRNVLRKRLFNLLRGES